MAKRKKISGVEKLTDKEEVFCQEYLKDLNGSAAVRRAEYAEGFQATLLLKKKPIAARIKQLMAERAERCQISAARVLEELASVAFSNVMSYVSIKDVDTIIKKPTAQKEAVTIKTTQLVFNDMSILDTRPIQSIKISDTTGVAIKLNDKVKALELLGDHLDIWNKLGKGTLSDFAKMLTEVDKDNGQ